MATVTHGSHPEPKKDPNRRTAFQAIAPPAQANKAQPFYGYEEIANLCARFITHLFACPDSPPATSQIHARLPHFIAYAFHRTKLANAVTFAALILLQRLKARFPTARGSSGHRLFLSAFMIASKIICDDTYSNKSWTIVGQGMFNLREVNQMEREMCSYLDWELTVDGHLLQNFEGMVRTDFGEPRAAYPTYSLSTVSKRAARAAASTSATPLPEPSSSSSPIPAFGHGSRQATPTMGDSPSSSKRKRVKVYGDMQQTPPPETPSPTRSAYSPASTPSPVTPNGPHDFSAKIRGVDTSPVFTLRRKRSKELGATGHPLKTKMFSVASATIW
ncbi:hypothetical protein BDZ89DRAFT_1090436 [Hymenopellis radicata]|nr:hypothetical protein BDZ89DRAFT_1090436 [Hymenopellis radicata]